MIRYCLVVIFSICLFVQDSYSQEESVRVRIPFLMFKNSDKMEHAYRLQERLRIWHNEKGKEYRDGIITKDEWELWLKEEYEPKHEAVVQFILETRKKARETPGTLELNINNAFETITVNTGNSN